jgi:hypothetical protein
MLTKLVILISVTLLPQNEEVQFHSPETYETRAACEEAMYERHFMVVEHILKDLPGQRYIVISKCEEPTRS